MFADSFSQATWELIAFRIQIILWILGACGLVLGIALYAAKENASYLKMQPRHLTNEQKANLADFLKKNINGVGSFTIKASVTANDARGYSDEIAGFFTSIQIGWTVKVDNAILTGPDIAGVWIVVRDPKAIPFVADALHAAFTAANIPIQRKLHLDPTGPGPDETWLCIGGRT